MPATSFLERDGQRIVALDRCQHVPEAELRGEQTQRVPHIAHMHHVVRKPAEAARLLQESLEKAGGTLLPWDEAEGDVPC
eukprot:2959315-Amphidinium_carterae.1